MTTTPPLKFTLSSNYTSLPYGSRRHGPTTYDGFPVRLSIPVAPGRCQPTESYAVRNQQGQPLPGVVRPFHLWPDGSVRAWEVWLPAHLKRQEVQCFELAPAPALGSAPGAPGVSATYDPSAPTRRASPAANREAPGTPSVKSQIPNPKSQILPTSFTLTILFSDGTTASQTISFPAPTAAGPVLEEEQPFEIHHGPTGLAFKGTLIHKSWSWYPGVELAIRLINYALPAESEIKAVTLEFDLLGASEKPAAPRYTIRHATFAAEIMPRLYTSGQPFDVRVEGAAYVPDIRQLGRQQTDYALYERGNYAGCVDPWIAVADDQAAWVLTIPEAGERSPKGWALRGRRVRLELHPEWSQPLTWRRGMALYQRFCVTRLAPSATPEECENAAQRWLRPPLVAVDADVYRAAGWRIPFRYEPARFPRTELTIRETWSFSWTTGTFEWGDQVGANKGSLPLPRGVPVSQGVARNLEYDFVACAAKEFARTGLPERWKQCRASAEHMMHTDFVAISDDPWQHGGIPHHCNRHTTGAAYPSHIWIEGLTLYYLMSGDRYALHVAQRVGDFFLKYIEKRWMVIEATAREMGWTLVALAAIYDVTREERYLHGMRKIVDHYLGVPMEDFFPTDATFAIGIAVIGLDRVRPFHRDADISAFILRVLDFMIEKRRDPTGIFEYNFDAEYRAFEWVQTHLPEALAIGYRLTGDVKYLKAAWRLFEIHRAGTPLTVQNKYQTDCGYAAGYHISWTMGPLADFAKRGWLDKLQFIEPE